MISVFSALPRQVRVGGLAFMPRVALMLGAGVVLIDAVPAITPAVFVVLALWAIRSPKHAVEAMTLAVMLGAINPAISSQAKSALRWLPLVAALGRILVAYPRGRFGLLRVRFYLLLFGIAAATSSALSFAPEVALTKLVVFLAVVMAVLVAFEDRPLQQHWDAWFTTVLVSLVIMSFAAVLLGFGFFKSARGITGNLQGITRQPNTLAFILAPMAAWLISAYLARALHRWAGMVIATTAAALFLTRSRNGLLAVAIGILVAHIVHSRRLRSALRARTHRGNSRFALVVMVGLVAVVASGGVSEIISKGRGSLEDSAKKRIAVIETSLDTFVEAPLFGSGFGLPSSEELLVVKRDIPLIGIPLSGTVDKVFLPTALLSWVGLVGTTLILLALGDLWRYIARYAATPHLAAATAALAVNISEPALFSAGGIGLFSWLIIGWALSDASGRRRRGTERTVAISSRA